MVTRREFLGSVAGCAVAAVAPMGALADPLRCLSAPGRMIILGCGNHMFDCELRWLWEFHDKPHWGDKLVSISSRYEKCCGDVVEQRISADGVITNTVISPKPFLLGFPSFEERWDEFRAEEGRQNDLG